MEPEDIDFIYGIENDTTTWDTGNTLIPYSRYQIEQYILSTDHDLYLERQLRLLIELNEGERKTRIGAIDLFDFDPVHKRAGVGIMVIPEERKKGYAQESLMLLSRYAFSTLALHQLHCSIASNNVESLELFKKAGFSECGIKREWRLENGAWVDEVMFQLIQP